MTDMEQQTNNILGYGEELEILIGVNKETGEKIIKKYHFTPVALAKIPPLMEKLDSFFQASENRGWNEAVIKDCAEILKMSLVKMQPEITIKEITENFGLGSLAKGISIVMDVNDFLSQMQVMTQKVQTMTKK